MDKKSFLDRFVEKKLGGYKHLINIVDNSLSKNLISEKKVAVVGGGIAGIVSSITLVERGFKVHLFEKENYLGGKIGSWPVEFNNGFKTNVEHGFHGFFRQYYNLREFLKKIDSFKHLIPIDDYLIVTKEKQEFRFKHINKTPVLNILSLAKNGVFKISPFLTNPDSVKMMDLLKYDPDKTFKKWDEINFDEFAAKLKLPKELVLVFETFARAFFADASKISMGELIKSFHYYFLSHDFGLIYDVLDDDFYDTFISKFLKKAANYNFGCTTEFHLGSLVMENEKFIINNEQFDYLVLAADIKGTKFIFENSVDIKENYPSLAIQFTKQKTAQRYAVLRIWTDKIIQGDYPFFIFTEAFEVLDSITLYHDMEKSSKRWAEENNGGIYELHSYAVSDEKLSEEQIRRKLLDEFYLYFPEMKSARIINEYLQVRDDFTAFHTGLYDNRPTYKTEIKNMYLAGDWVKLPIPSMLMEAAATSALFAANEILRKENLQEEKIYSVPPKGIFA